MAQRQRSRLVWLAVVALSAAALTWTSGAPPASASTTNSYPVGGSCNPSDSTDQVCDPVSEVNINVTSPSTLDIWYTAPGFCSEIKVAISVDGGAAQESDFLSSGSTEVFTFGPVGAGAHTVSVQATGRDVGPGDCNYGWLSAWGGGLLYVNVASAPPAPSGCVATPLTLSNDTAVEIPAGPAVVTSTINVSGADPYLWDVDAWTDITHSFSSDLDITLTSPAGTVVTLTTDNGDDDNDVFNGTIWDDDANPGGQVPYTTNNGLVTDNAFVDLALASPLVPEEAMGAFIGEDPNGTWTLTISDGRVVDSGNLNGWRLDLTTLPAAPTTTNSGFSNSTAVAIPDGPAVITSTIALSGATGSLSDLNVSTFITHTFPADLDITVTSPAGTVVTLTTDNGGGETQDRDNVFNGTVWDDDANPGGQVPYATNNGLVTDHSYGAALASPLVPEEAMGAFIGEDPNGTWTLTISDDAQGDTGNLSRWDLDLTTATCETYLPPPPPPPPPEICFKRPVTVDLARGQSPTNGPDVIRGTTGDDIINALGGDDIICSLGGEDIVSGNQGQDRAFGGGGDDEMRGNSGDDILRGRAGDDLLYGQAGNDTLDGGPDTDNCRGGTGLDTATACETTVGVP